jgi:ribosomal protein S6--L-glutamate ligase
MGNGVFRIENKAQFLEYAERNEVLYVQEYLPTDRDLRVCFVGDEVIGAYWRVGTPDDFRNNVAQGGTVVYDLIPDEAIQLVTRVAQELGINHAGFDILYSDGVPYILEFNTLFGNQGILQMGKSIEEKIMQYLQNQFSPDYPTSPVSPFTRKRIS